MELAIAADSHETRRARDWLATACRQRSVPKMEVERLALILEEVLANIVAHGGETARSEPIRVQLEVEGGNAALVTVSDAGKAFDPLNATLQSVPLTLEDATPGGMGLRMIRQCTPLQYRREAGRNHLTFGTRWSPDSIPS